MGLNLNKKIDDIAKKIFKISFRKIYADMEAKKDKRELFNTFSHGVGRGIREVVQHLTSDGKQYLISRIQSKIPHKITWISGSFYYYQTLTSEGKWKKDRDTITIYIDIETKKANYSYECGYEDAKNYKYRIGSGFRECKNKHLIHTIYNCKYTKEEMDVKFTTDIWDEADELFR